ncbi:MAG: (Fe-S)-binding protein [Sedimentibacter saalensis]|jgi:DNA repair exonuclease SbcCD ATPase subunit|uniref:(Fe-S)-binding protein n=1 Tax=Sedimentibacter saalensis TaxID=130788 RepID=UPI002B2116EB|nr:(Fe-S)-binding protein [Sedimentibacter saalensis]MEA5096236.1 (Fe-S)-binding protein [Sedimentibacter saalensis]
MVLDKYAILATLPKKSNEGGGHLNCKECGFQSCVVFAMKVENGKTLLSKCPYVNYNSFNQTQQVPAAATDLGYIQQQSEKSKKDKKKQSSHQVVDISTGLIISNNNLFVEKLNSLKEFNGQLPKETNLPTVPTEGWFFGLGDHNVTGNELNNLTENIQDRMIETNKTVIKVVQELAAIYDTFSALDKVYVQEFYFAINTAFKAIEEIKVTNVRISDQQKDISGTQQDIKQVINQQKQIIQVLKSFKEKLEKLEHLYDIDKTFNEVRVFQAKIETLEKVSAEYKNNIEKVAEVQSKFSESLESLSDSNDVFSEKIQKLSVAVGELKKLSSELEKATAQNERNQVNTEKAIESIKNDQKNLENSFDKQKADIERLYSIQKEFAVSIYMVKEADDRLSEKLSQAVQKAEQRFSEIERAAEKQNADNAEKCSSFENEVKKCEQAAQSFYSKTNSEIEQLTANTVKQYETLQNELTVLCNENATLSKSLLLAKGISIASLALSSVLFILILTGVLG